MAAGKYNIIIEQGADFSFDFTVKEDGVARDLTGYSLRGQLRPKKSSPTLSGTFVCIVTDAVNGTGKVSMTNATTAALTPSVQYYDIEMYTAADANVVRLLEGRAEVTAEVTV